MINTNLYIRPLPQSFTDADLFNLCHRALSLGGLPGDPDALAPKLVSVKVMFESTHGRSGSELPRICKGRAMA